MSTLSESPWLTVSSHEYAAVRQHNQTKQNAFFSLHVFKAGDVIAPFSASTISKEPTYLTVQVGLDKHITLQPEHLQYINHSCEPNVLFDTTLMQLVALKDIEAGDELTFFYPSTEWDMAQPFTCYCGYDNCLGEIKGAAHLPEDILKQYRLTDFIKNELEKRSKIRRA